MIYAPSPLAIGVFVTFILLVIGLSAWLGRRATSASGYYAAHGEIHWFVNGIASPATTCRRRRSSASAG